MKTKLLILGFFVFSLGMNAQNELPEKFKDETSIIKKTKLNFPKEGRKSKSGGGYSVSLKLLKEAPKKVALVSFFTFDPGLTKSYSFSSSTSTTTVTKKLGSSKGGAAALVDEIYYASVDKLVEKFKSYGMELLLPDQFLNTEEKKTYYNNYKVEHDKFDSFMKNIGSNDHNVLFAYPYNYIPMDVVYEPFHNYSKSGILSTMDYKRKVSDSQTMLFLKDEKMQNSVGYDLATNLGVDAVLIVYLTIYCPKDTRVVMQNANMILMGPNPIQPKGDENKPMFYRKGQFYCATRFQPDITIWNVSKKDPSTKELNSKGFDYMFTGMATVIGKYISQQK